MGCISSKYVTRSNSFQEELRHRFQGRSNGLPALEDFLLSKNGGDQFLALVCTANTVAQKLCTGAPALESNVAKNPTAEKINLESVNTWELMAGLDEREVERKKEETSDCSTTTLTPRSFHVVRGTEGEGSRRYGSFHTVEEYDSMVAGSGSYDVDGDDFILQKTHNEEPGLSARSNDTGYYLTVDGNTVALVGSRDSKKENKTEDTRDTETQVLETSRNYDTSDSRSFCMTKLVITESPLPMPELPEASVDCEPLKASRNYDPLDSTSFCIAKLASTKSSIPIPYLLEASMSYDPPAPPRSSCDMVLQNIGLSMPFVSTAACEVTGNLSVVAEETAKGRVTDEKGSKRRARAKELEALDIPADGFNFPSIGSLRDWLNCGGVTPKFGNASNSGEPCSSEGNDRGLDFFDPEIVAAFEEAMEELTAEEELVLKQIVERWEEEGG